jgi:hypothetical protein
MTQSYWEQASLEWTLISIFYHKMAAILLNHIASQEDRKVDKAHAGNYPNYKRIVLAEKLHKK